MEDREKTHRDQRAFVLTLIAAALETVLCEFLLLRIPADAKNAFLFGLSKERLLMLAVFILLFLLILAGLLFRDRLRNGIFSQRAFGILCSAAAVISSFFVLLPEYRFRRNAAYFTRLKPYVLWVFLVTLTFALYISRITGRFSGSKETVRNLSESKKHILAVLAVLAAGILFVELTGLGKTPETSLWNGNGIPLQSIQLYSLVLLFYLLYTYGFFDFLSRHKHIPHFLIIWLLAAVIWAQAPLLPHFFCTLPYRTESGVLSLLRCGDL